MKSNLTLISTLLLLALTACSDREAEVERARQATEAKARAEAAKKEMETLPKTFRNRDYLEKNKPVENTETSEAKTEQ